MRSHVTEPVAGYFRVSQARDDMSAPEIYQEQIQRYCHYKDLKLKEIFSDIDYSGFRGARKRPSLEALKQERSRFSAVVVPRLSRFGRSMSELIQLFDLFDGEGISLVFLDMNLDSSTSQGRLLRHVMAAFAEYESDEKADYARANYRHAMQQGRTWGCLRSDIAPRTSAITSSRKRPRSSEPCTGVIRRARA